MSRDEPVRRLGAHHQKGTGDHAVIERSSFIHRNLLVSRDHLVPGLRRVIDVTPSPPAAIQLTAVEERHYD
jgi:hypothetical protein